MDTDNYYEILGLDKDANNTQIKEAYIYKVNILHPDRLNGMPERVRLQAEKEIKSVNIAYSVLSDPKKRQQYDITHFGRDYISNQTAKVNDSRKPRIEVFPKEILLENSLPYVPRKASFFIRNTGGTFNKVFIGKTPEWIRIVNTNPINEGQKLPLQVHLEAVGIQWNTQYSSKIKIRLDESETVVKITLQIIKEPS